MKKGIEELFKNSLENSQEAYNPSAWLDMQKRLDHLMPVAAPKSNVGRNLGLGLAGLVVVGAGTWFLTQSDASKQIANNANKNIESTAEKSVDKENLKKTIAEKEVIPPKVIVPKEVVRLEEMQSDSPIEKIGMNDAVPNPQSFIEELLPELTNQTLTETDIKFGQNVFVSQNAVCLNAMATIKNENNAAVFVIVENKTLKIEKKGSISVNFKNAGSQSIQLLNNKNQFMDEAKIMAKEVLLPEVNFSELEYKNGLPTIVANVSNSNDFTATKWIFAKGIIGEESKVSVHPYRKNSSTLFVTVQDVNGCINSSQHEMTVENDYNLLAQTGLNPASSNPAVSSFMPRALVDRNTAFTLTITDTKTRSVIFQTSDASNPWNGTDKTGRMMSGGSYIWTVILSNPEPNEQKQYGGELVLTSSN